jgi:hypothetical protein
MRPAPSSAARAPEAARLHHYLGGDPSAWSGDKDWVDLKLDLGAGDKVSDGDRYDVLGDPGVDPYNRGSPSRPIAATLRP